MHHSGSITGVLCETGRYVDDLYDFLDIIVDQSSDTAAAVVLGQHKTSGAGNHVAIKIIEKSKLDSDKKRRRLENEISLMSRVSHDNIIRMVEVFETDEDVSIVMEFVNGGDLFDMVVRAPKRRLPLIESKRCMKHMLQALKYLHSDDVAIVHRDIKPENVMVQKDGELLYKLVDFGLAKTLKRDESSGKLALSYSTSGTLLYCSPERLEDDDAFVINKGVDLWSVGCVLYFVTHGEPPFCHDLHAIRDADVFQDKVFDRIVENDLRINNENMDELCRDLMGKLLNPDPSERIDCSLALKHPWIIMDDGGNNEEYESESTITTSSKEEIDALKKSVNCLMESKRLK